ncbi:type II toxin-antitoxin system RelE/ParE family toxin [uncultured Desulfovibrio sp.]|uniref:type II toxin-antitoxin system RelE/ParE family toxin n=1 Tax=uncultured Desulfovibrio sp. TaxID=167968 RepID=UPI0003A5F4F8|nr:type II toxin-antitoxin system RelE/ParE family toxin [uncultured Desulfovibrio sp.]
MNTIFQSDLFISWLARLKDMRAKFSILARIRRAEMGNFGDCKSVGGGVSEMRVHTGKGYRVYFMQEGDRVYILVVGGDKSSQQKDIETAIALAKERKALL